MNADLAVDRSNGTLAAQLDASTSALSIGIPEADRLIGAAPKLSLELTQDSAGLVTLEEAKLDGAALDLTAGGHHDGGTRCSI